MRWPSALYQLLLIAVTAVSATPIDDNQIAVNETILEIANNLTLIDHRLYLLNGTEDGDSENGSVRKKRTFGDLVFRGLADVLGYNVQRKLPQTSFPPPVAPLPQFSIQVTATQAAPVGCATRQADNACSRVNQQQAAAPCARQQAQANPCNARARATPPPCDAPPTSTRAPDVVSSNFQLNFAFNRNNPQAQAGVDAALTAADAPVNVPFNPAPAKLPPPPPPRTTRKPKVFIDAFVVKGNGETQKLNTVDAAQFDPDQYDYDQQDYRDAPPPSYDYYEDVQESQNQKSPPRNSYYSPIKYTKDGPRSQSISLPPPSTNKIPVEDKRRYNPAERLHVDYNDYLASDDPESTTSTEDPQKVLVPRILPHTENHPNQIDTITVRVPPIYKAKNPRKLHQGDDDSYTPSPILLDDLSSPKPRRKKRKKIIKVRNKRYAREQSESGTSSIEAYAIGSDSNERDSGESSSYRLPADDKDPDFARVEAAPPPWSSEEEESYRADESERDSGESEKYIADESERGNPTAPDPHRANEDERRNNKLSPFAQVYEDGFSTSFAKVTATRVDDNNPKIIKVTRRKLKH